MDPTKDRKDSVEAPGNDPEHERDDPVVNFVDDGGRPKIQKYTHEAKFRPNDYVFIQVAGSQAREGPYIIASVKGNKYTLCDTRGRIAKHGATFSENDLQLQDPFA